MKKVLRASLTAGALAAGLLLAGCENFDPTAIFDSDIFNTKKKLPGERRPVFPEGTPGVPQGVPPELVKGYQPPPTPAALPKKEAAPPKEATAEPAESKPKPKAKPKAKPVVAKPAEPSEDSQPSQQSGAVTVRPSSQGAQWPDPPAAQQGPVAGRWPDAPMPGGGAAWPDPPAPR